MIIFWHSTGPLIKYADEILTIESLNPENSIKWRVTRFELIKIGVNFLVAALRYGLTPEPYHPTIPISRNPPAGDQ